MEKFNLFWNSEYQMKNINNTTQDKLKNAAN